MRRALGRHWPEYAAEGLGLGIFMLSACLFGTLIFHPGSGVAAALPDGLARRLLMGLAMGTTAVALIHWPPGRRSGAHLNPATTLTFWRLGKVAGADAAWYTLAQTVGGLAGILVATLVIDRALADPSVNYVATVPGMGGLIAAFVAEVVIAGTLMTVVLTVSNSARLAPYTGLCAGALVAGFITLESPVSGMSMNPARSLASAVPAGTWDVLWIYLVAPPLGMLAAAELHVRRHGLSRVFCAKLHHGGGSRCIFQCRFHELQTAPTTTKAAAASRPRTQEATR